MNALVTELTADSVSHLKFSQSLYSHISTMWSVLTAVSGTA